jgi:translation initiation factor IF-2
MDERRGVIATVLVQNGTLAVGDIVVIGEKYAKVRAMFNDHGERVKDAGPSTPVAILGFPAVPTSGDSFEVVESERVAREIVNKRAGVRRDAGQHQRRPISLEEIYQRMQSGEVKELNLLLKADVQGSIDPIVKSFAATG